MHTFIHACIHSYIHAVFDESSSQQGAGHKNHFFAKELVDLFELLRQGELPQPLSKALCKLLVLCAHNSSLQQTVPFTIVPIIQSIINSEKGEDSFTSDVQFKLGSWLGQPAVLDVFTNLKGQTSTSLVQTVFGFLGHLCQNVSYTLPRAAYMRVLERIPKVWTRAFPQLERSSATGSSDGQRASSHSCAQETEEQLRARTAEELLNGIYYPMAKKRERGVYPHAESVSSTKCTDKSKDEDDCTCSKKFPHAPGHTCEKAIFCVCVYIYVYIVCVCIYAYVYIYTYVCMYLYICIHILQLAYSSSHARMVWPWVSTSSLLQRDAMMLSRR